MTARHSTTFVLLILLIFRIAYSDQKPIQKGSADLEFNNESDNILMKNIGKIRDELWSHFESRSGLEKLKAAISYAIAFVPDEKQRVELIRYLRSARNEQIEGNDWPKQETYWGSTDALAFLGDREAEKELLNAYQEELQHKSSMFSSDSWTGSLYVHIRGGIFYLTRVLTYDDQELRNISWSILNTLDPTLKRRYDYDPAKPAQNQLPIIQKITSENLQLLENPPPSKKTVQSDDSSKNKSSQDVPEWTLDLIEPRVLKRVDPIYPENSVITPELILLNVLITEEGNVDDVKILYFESGNDKVAKAVTDAVKKWKFNPATTKDGKSLSVWKSLAFQVENK